MKLPHALKLLALRRIMFVLLGLAYLVVSSVGGVQAFTSRALEGIADNTYFYDPTACPGGGVADPKTGAGCACSSSTGVAGTLPKIIPEPYNGAFTGGANKHNVSPALIAALFTEENFTGIDPAKLPDQWASFPSEHHDPNSGWPTNQFHTMGAFQFIPDTWKTYGDDGNGDGIKDAQNIFDGAAGAANYVAANGATKDKPPAEWRNAIFAYNHANWYVDAILKYYDYYNSGGTAVAGTPSQPSSAGCSGSNGVSPDGFVFPQKTTKSQLANQKPSWDPNCVNPVPEMGPGSTLPGSNPAKQINGLCHHDYLAADIFNATGTPVLAPRPGIVKAYHDGGSVGWTIRIYSDKAVGGDGLWYYMAHMLKPSEGGQLFTSEGQQVKAGDQVGVVGTNADAQGTPSHTHFDISPVDNSFSRGFSGTDGPLLDPMPALKPSWEGLPS